MVIEKGINSLPVYSYARDKLYNPLFNRATIELKGGLKNKYEKKFNIKYISDD